MPKNLDDDDFTVSIRKFMQYFDIEDKTKTKFIAYPEKDINLYTPAKIKVHIYQIVQELMTNAQKHANAKNIEIQLNWIDDLFTLIYEDDGVGFDSTATKNGIGLSNIKNRITQLDGQLIIDSRRNHGSVIDLQIPYKNHSDEI